MANPLFQFLHFLAQCCTFLGIIDAHFEEIKHAAQHILCMIYKCRSGMERFRANIMYCIKIKVSYFRVIYDVFLRKRKYHLFYFHDKYSNVKLWIPIKTDARENRKLRQNDEENRKNWLFGPEFTKEFTFLICIS